MGFKSFMVRQLGKPSGLFSPLMARMLNRGNARQNSDCIDALSLTSEMAVLDIGFGGGVSFPRLLKEAGSVAGTEISPEMIARARSVWAAEIADGRLEIARGGAGQMPFGDGRFDRVMTVNTLYFWPDLEAGLADVLRVMAPGGRFVTSVVPGQVLAKMGFGDQGFRTESPDFYAEALRSAGYADVAADDTGDAKGSVLVSGGKPA